MRALDGIENIRINQQHNEDLKQQQGATVKDVKNTFLGNRNIFYLWTFENWLGRE